MYDSRSDNTRDNSGKGLEKNNQPPTWEQVDKTLSELTEEDLSANDE